ncbi:MAG: tetratricopeptide repeat protein [Crocinitomicaceae bacterium]
MIQILRGTKKAVENTFIERQNESGIWMYAPTDFPIGWFGIRLIMDQIDEERRKKVIANNKAVCSFVIPSLIDEFNQEEQDERDILKAQVFSHMNRPYEIFEAMAAVLKELLDGEEHRMFIPNMAPLDFESIQTVVTYLRLYTPKNFQLIVGFAIDLKASPDDENGIIWERNPLVVQNMISSFEINGEMIDVFEDASNKTDEELYIYPNLDFPLHAHEEQKVFDLLNSNVELSAAQTDSIMDTIENSFENYSFRGTIRLGIMLSESDKKQVTEKTSRLHTLIASAAHFFQFSHDGNPPFDVFLEATLKKALEEDKRPEIRCALLYRMAFTKAERLEDVDGGLPFANLAVKESKDYIEIDPLMGNYAKSWAHMIRGFIHGFQNKHEKFHDDVTTAVRLIREQLPALENAKSASDIKWKIEYDAGFFSHVNHQVFISEELQLFDYSMKMFSETEAAMENVHRINLFDPFHWLDFHRNKYQFTKALASARSGIKDGIKYTNGIYVYIYYFSAGDISYRVGEIEDALGFWLEAERTRPVYNDTFADFSLNVFIANCQILLGHLDDAEERLLKELSENEEMDLHSKLATISALRGDSENATSRMNDAIELASNSEDLMSLITVATSAGKIEQILSNNEAAIEAYEQAMEFVKDGYDDYHLMNAAVLIDLYLGLLELTGYDESLTVKLLQLIPKGADTPDAWQSFPRAIPFVEEFMIGNHENLSEQEKDDLLKPFFKFVALRVDCNMKVDQLKRTVVS